MNVAVLIGIAVIVVVGVALVPVVVNTINGVETSYAERGEEVPSTLLAFIDILPIVFVAILIIGVVGIVAYFVGNNGVNTRRKKNLESEQVVFKSDRANSIVEKKRGTTPRVVKYEEASRDTDSIQNEVDIESVVSKANIGADEWVKDEAFGTRDGIGKRVKKRLMGN